MLLVIDPRYFDSVIVTSMRDDVHSDYGGETLEELRDRYDNPFLITVTPAQTLRQSPQPALRGDYGGALLRPFRLCTSQASASQPLLRG